MLLDKISNALLDKVVSNVILENVAVSKGQNHIKVET